VNWEQQTAAAANHYSSILNRHDDRAWREIVHTLLLLYTKSSRTAPRYGSTSSRSRYCELSNKRTTSTNSPGGSLSKALPAKGSDRFFAQFLYAIATGHR